MNSIHFPKAILCWCFTLYENQRFINRSRCISLSLLCGLSQHVLLYGRVSDPSAYLLSLSFTVNPLWSNMHFRDHRQGNFYSWSGIRNRYQNYTYTGFQEQLKNCALSSSTVHHYIISNASNRSLTFVLWPHYSRYLSGRVARHSTLKSSV